MVARYIAGLGKLWLQGISVVYIIIVIATSKGAPCYIP